MTYIRQNNRIGIRLLTLADSALIVQWRNQEWVRQNYIYRETFTLEGQESYYHSKIETGLVTQFIVCELATGRPIGCTVLNDYEDGVHGEYGMFLGEQDAVGHGYSPEMVRLTLDYAFTELGLSEVHSRIMADNGASIAGCARGGMHAYATDPGVVCSDGKARDMVLVGATREDFYSC